MAVRNLTLSSAYTLIAELYSLGGGLGVVVKVCLWPKIFSSNKSSKHLDSHLSKVPPHLVKAVNSWIEDVCVCGCFLS